MPKDLGGLLQWFELACSAETPDRLHVHAVWRDRVSPSESEVGIKPVGGSETGTPAYAEPFRKALENAPSELDKTDPATTSTGQAYFLRPVAAAIARIARAGKPLMARHLLMLRAAGFDWRGRANRIGWAHEEYEVYIREALIRLWREHREWVRSD